MKDRNKVRYNIEQKLIHKTKARIKKHGLITQHTINRWQIEAEEKALSRKFRKALYETNKASKNKRITVSSICY